MNRTVTYSPLLLRWIQRGARNGLSAEQIAKRYHQQVPFVLDLCRLHGITITGVARPDHVPGRTPATEQSTIGVRLANESLTKIEREAVKRGTTGPLLAAQLLNIIAADEMFSAVLDL
jgi:hypothetical protein